MTLTPTARRRRSGCCSGWRWGSTCATVRARPPGAVKRSQRSLACYYEKPFCMEFLYGRAGRLTALFGGCRPAAPALCLLGAAAHVHTRRRGAAGGAAYTVERRARPFLVEECSSW